MMNSTYRNPRRDAVELAARQARVSRARIDADIAERQNAAKMAESAAIWRESFHEVGDPVAAMRDTGDPETMAELIESYHHGF